jgi:predicted nicotinamide N-methyase
MQNTMNSGYSTIPFSPTQGLPKLACLANIPTSNIKSALDNLKTLYFPTITDELSRQASKVLYRSSKAIVGSGSRLHGQATPVPDSGYASAEEEEDEEEEHERSQDGDTLRSDPFERAYTLKWLTGFIGRSDIWLSSVSSDDEESERAELVEEAIKLINAFSGYASSSSSAEDNSTGEDKTDGSILRSFSFLTPAPESLEKSEITVQLNDAPLSSSDHTSVGLQSWGSSIIFAERLCSDPAAFSILPRKAESTTEPLRVLELGAGTGLLSVTISKIAQLHSTTTTIAATDFHPDVLTNLTSNIATNTHIVVPPRSAPPMISVYKFDWEHPDYLSPPFNEPFDVILAADVVYHPLHAAWIKSCVERLLFKPGANEQGGVFWLIIPIRTTGRHEGMHCTVEKLFPIVLREERHYSGGKYELAILQLEVVAKKEGIGRADESGYRLYKIGWVPSQVLLV